MSPAQILDSILCSPRLTLERYLAINKLTDILANSAGCIPKPPIPNQALAPPLTVPNQ